MHHGIRSLILYTFVMFDSSEAGWFGSWLSEIPGENQWETHLEQTDSVMHHSSNKLLLRSEMEPFLIQCLMFLSETALSHETRVSFDSRDANHSSIIIMTSTFKLCVTQRNCEVIMIENLFLYQREGLSHSEHLIGWIFVSFRMSLEWTLFSEIMFPCSGACLWFVFCVDLSLLLVHRSKQA